MRLNSGEFGGVPTGVPPDNASGFKQASRAALLTMAFWYSP